MSSAQSLPWQSLCCLPCTSDHNRGIHPSLTLSDHLHAPLTITVAIIGLLLRYWSTCTHHRPCMHHRPYSGNHPVLPISLLHLHAQTTIQWQLSGFFHFIGLLACTTDHNSGTHLTFPTLLVYSYALPTTTAAVIRLFLLYWSSCMHYRP